LNILITSAGRRVSLVNYFQAELKQIFGLDAKVLTTDLQPDLSPACRHSDESLEIGRFADEHYVEDLLSICLRKDVKIVIPTIDPELLLLGENRKLFQDKGIAILVSDPALINLFIDKRKTHIFFAEKGFGVPREIDRANPSYPLFIKPIDGSSSQNLHHIEGPSQVSSYLTENQFMWMEYLDPKDYTEYTIDLYYDNGGILKCVVPRIRIAVREGETNKGITDKNRNLIDFLRSRLGLLEGARGCLTLQVFMHRKNDSVIGIEVNPRFGGGYPLSYLAGANYPKWILEEYLLEQPIKYFDDWEDRLLLLRYDAEMVIHDFEYQA